METIQQIAGETGHVQRCHDGNNVEVVMDDFQKEQSVYLLKDSWLEILPVQESVNNKLNKLKKKIMTLLVNAAAEGQLIVLKDLFRQYRLGVNDQAEKGRTALQSACQRGQMEIIEWLVERKADVNLKDDKGRAAIHHAAKR